MSSRSKISILTFSSEFIFKILITILGVVKTRMLIFYLGDSTNGLYQLIIQLLAFVTIADLGLDSIYRFSYYRPLHQKDTLKVNRIYNGSRLFYKKAGIAMLFLAVGISCIFPFIAKNTSFDYIALVIFMMLFALPSIIEAFFSADISLISAQQKNLQVHFYNNLRYIFRLIISFITLMTKNFLLFILVDSIISIIFTLIRYFKLKHYNNQFVNNTNEVDNTPIAMTKYTLFSSVNSIIYTSTDNLVISSFLGLAQVSVYSSYFFVIKALSDIITISIGSIVDSVGDFFATSKNTFDLFSKISLILFFISILLLPPLFLGLSSFIFNFISSNKLYIIDIYSYNLFSLLFVLLITTSIWDVIIKANGIYKETWKITLVESLSNIILSIILIHFIGFSGVLLGTIIARLLKTLYFTVYLGQKYSFSLRKQGLLYAKQIIYIVIVLIALNYILQFINIQNIFNWIIVMAIVFVISFLSNLLIFKIIFPDFIKECYQLLKNLKLKS